MALKDIADRLDEAVARAGDYVTEREAQIVETNERKMAHNIVAYVLENASTGIDPYQLGQAMVQGAVIGEDESHGVLAQPVIDFLKELTDGAENALSERYGADAIYHDPVQHAVQYMLDHNRWPESASPATIAKAKAALAAGKKGSTSNKKAFGDFL